MRKVKISQEENGTFMIKGQEPYPELKGKKVVILAMGSSTSTSEGESEWEITSDEAFMLTEEEFELVREKIKAADKGKKAKATQES